MVFHLTSQNPCIFLELQIPKRYTKMTTKMKGLFKGLRYISQIFEEDKEQEDIQIGLPTDVKHVAHIGWDGPSADDSNPSWMNEFKATNGQSAPLDSNGNNIEGHEIKWVSEDSKKGNRAMPDSSGRDIPEIPRSSRRHSSSDNNNNDSPRKKDSSTKPRQSRRNNSKDASEVNSGLPSDLPPDDLAKKSRRKKPKDTDGGRSTRPRSKDTDGDGSTRSRSKNKDGGGSRPKPPSSGGALPYSDPGPDTGSVLRTIGSPLDPISSMHDAERERRVIS